MKMMKQMLVVLFTGLLAVLPSMSVWATSNNYWGYATQTVKVGTSGGGKVYVNTSNSTNGAVWSTESTISGQTETSSTSAPNSLEVPFYIFAQADSPAKTFDHWSTSADGSDTYKVDGNKVTVISACISAANKDAIPSGKTPTAGTTLYAIFRDSIPVNLTFGAVEGDSGDSYSVKIGNETYTVSSSEFVYNGYESVAVTCTGFPASDARKVIGWYYRDAGGTEQEIGIENAFSRTFTECATIYPKFVDKVNVVATCKPAENGTYSVQKKGTGTSAVRVEGEDVEVENFDSLTVTFKATPAKGYVFYSWYKKDGEGRVTYFSNQPTVEDYLFNVSVEVGAIFEARKQVAVRFDESVAGSGFTKTCTNSDIDFDTTADGFVGYDTATIALATTVEVDKQPRWWYKVGGSGEKVYFSFARSVTKTFEESVLVGVDFASGDDSLAALVAEAVGAGETSVTLSSDEAVMVGTTAVIPEGFTVVVPAGRTLYVDGTLAVSGTLTVEGTVSKCSKMLVQSGDGLQPLNPYGTVKYWKTAVGTVSASITGWSGTTATHMTLLRGDGVSIRCTLATDTTVVQCTVDSAIALNHITGFVAGYSKLADASVAIFHNNNQMLLLVGNATVSNKTEFPSAWQDSSYGKINNPLGTIDCAGNTCTVGSNAEMGGSESSTFLNGKVSVSKMAGCTLSFINCSSVTVSTFNINNASYRTSVKIYDCTPTPSIKTSGSAILTNGGIFYYSGGSVSSPYAPSFTGNYHVFGGTFSKDPTKYLGGNDLEVVQPASSRWTVRKKIAAENEAKIGGTEYETLQGAVDAASAGAVVELLRDVELEQPVTVAEEKSLRLELAGFSLTGSHGVLVNHGTLAVEDSSHYEKPSSVTATGGSLFVNDGDLSVTYGTYSGAIVLNGGTFTTWNGTFNGTIMVTSSIEDPTVVGNLVGGKFSSNTYSHNGTSRSLNELCAEGHQVAPGNYIAMLPSAYLSDTSLNGADVAFAVQAFEPLDQSLWLRYSGNGDRSMYQDEEWHRIAELHSAVAPYSGWRIEGVLHFDRAVEAGTITAHGKTSVLPFSMSLNQSLGKDEPYLILQENLSGGPITYSRFLPGGEASAFSVGASNNTNASDNKGTTCFLEMRIYSGAQFLTLAKKTYVFGAGTNTAMIQPISGAASFYSKLETAVGVVGSAGTVKLCNDCAETVTVGKVCEIDTNGFAFTGEVVAAPGYAVEEANGVYTVTALPVDLAVTAQMAATQTADAIGLAGGLSVEVAQALTGQTPTYQLAKRNGTGAFVPMGNAVDDPSTLTLDLKNGDPSGVYKVNLLVGERVVESDNALGVLACAPSAKTVIVAVPWGGTAGGDISVAELFRACDLAAGDQVKYYNPVAQQYEMWTWSATEGWVANNTVATSGTFTQAPAATARTLARGAAVWLTRAGAAAPFYLCGAFKADAATTAITAGTASVPVWNLVAPPTLTPFDLNQIATGVAAGDRILVPMGATRREYSFKDGAWGYPKTGTKTIGGETVLTTTRCTTETIIPAGTGFWYISAGGAPTIEWGCP